MDARGEHHVQFTALVTAPITLMFVQLDHKVTPNDACWNK
jgi:hypothetical protein